MTLKEKEFYIVCLIYDDGTNKTSRAADKIDAEGLAEALAVANPGLNVFILEPTVKVCNKPKIEREFIY